MSKEEVWRKARKKPVVVEFRKVEPKEVVASVFDKKKGAIVNLYGESIYTMEGWLKATCGKDYIIKGVKGEIYPIDKQIFKETYEVVDEK